MQRHGTGYLRLRKRCTAATPVSSHRPALSVILHTVISTRFHEISSSEQRNFIYDQVMPFYLRMSDGESLHAQYALPLGLHCKHAAELIPEVDGLTDGVP